MSSLVSRLLVAVVGLPLVIGVVYLGGWWLFGLALVGGLIALHELYVMARELRPLVLAGYVGYALTLLGLQLGDLPWMLGGLLITLVPRLRPLRPLGHPHLGDDDVRGDPARGRLDRRAGSGFCSSCATSRRTASGR